MTQDPASNRGEIHGGGIRIVVLGTSGSGKTTLAKALSRRLGVPHVESDAFRYGPNWTKNSDDCFRERLADALAGESWVADGNFEAVRDLVWTRATNMVWLDYSMPVVILRRLRRISGRPKAKQDAGTTASSSRGFWSRVRNKGVVLARVIRSRAWNRRHTFPELFLQPDYSHLKVARLRSPRSAEKWLLGVHASQEIARSESISYVASNHTSISGCETPSNG